MTETLEARALLTAGALDADPGSDGSDEIDVPQNVTLRQEPGYFEVAVEVSETVVNQAIFSQYLRYPLEEGTPVLIDNDALLGERPRENYRHRACPGGLAAFALLDAQ